MKAQRNIEMQNLGAGIVKNVASNAAQRGRQRVQQAINEESETQGGLFNSTGMQAFRGILGPLILAGAGFATQAELDNQVEKQNAAQRKEIEERTAAILAGKINPSGKFLPPVYKPCPEPDQDIKDFCRWRPWKLGCNDLKFTFEVPGNTDPTFTVQNQSYGSTRGNDALGNATSCKTIDRPPCPISDKLRQLCDKTNGTSSWCDGQKQNGLCYDQALAQPAADEEMKTALEVRAAGEDRKRKRGLINDWVKTRGCSYEAANVPPGVRVPTTHKTPCDVPFAKNARIGDIAETGTARKTAWKFLGWIPEVPFDGYMPGRDADFET